MTDSIEIINLQEIWLPIENYVGDYEVSNLGRIRSFKNNKIKIMQPALNHGGYKHLLLTKNGVPKGFRIHRIVAKTFIPNPMNKECVNHIDGNKLNNNSNNLEWVTKSENMQHAYDNNLKLKMFGKCNGQSKLNIEKANEIRKLFASGNYTKVKLAKIFNVTDATIGNVVRNKNWAESNEFVINGGKK